MNQQNNDWQLWKTSTHLCEHTYHTTTHVSRGCTRNGSEVMTVIKSRPCYIHSIMPSKNSQTLSQLSGREDVCRCICFVGIIISYVDVL